MGVAACAVAYLVHASDACAYCRAVTENAPNAYDPATAGACFLGDASALALYWRNRCVSYSVQKDGSPLRGITFDEARAVAAQAFSAWNQVSCEGTPISIHASEMEPAGDGGVECDHVQYDEYGPNQHVLVFRDRQAWGGDASNTLGLTTISYDATTGEIFDADIEINSHDFAIAVPPAPAGSYDLLTILTHEAGHFLGLAHSADRTAVMYAHYASGTNALTADDVTGICSIDRPDGTRPTSLGAVPAEACDPTPRHGFASACAPEDDAGHVVGPADATAAPDRAGTPAVMTSAADAAAGMAWLPPPRSGGGSCAMSSGCAPRGSAWAAGVVLSGALTGARRRRIRPNPGRCPCTRTRVIFRCRRR